MSHGSADEANARLPRDFARAIDAYQDKPLKRLTSKTKKKSGNNDILCRCSRFYGLKAELRWQVFVGSSSRNVRDVSVECCRATKLSARV